MASLPGYRLNGSTYDRNSSVFIGVREKDELKVAVKKVNKPAAKHEASLLTYLHHHKDSLSHPGALHIGKLIEIVEIESDEKCSYLVMPQYVPCDPNKASSGEVLLWMYQLIQAVAYCHSVGVVHVDIKPANVMLCPLTNRLILIDFGHSCFFKDLQGANQSATDAYSPLEVLYDQRTKFSHKIDTWSVGITCAEWSMNARLFEKATEKSSLARVVLDFFVPRKWVFEFPKERGDYTTADVCKFINCMLQAEPEDRFEISDLVSVNAFKSVLPQYVKLVWPELKPSQILTAYVKCSGVNFPLSTTDSSAPQTVLNFLRYDGKLAAAVIAKQAGLEESVLDDIDSDDSALEAVVTFLNHRFSESL